MYVDVCHWCLRKVNPKKDTQKGRMKVFCSMDCIQKEYLFQQWQHCAVKIFFHQHGREEDGKKSKA